MSELNSLPVVTADDNGKLLTVVDGEWKPSFSYSYKVMNNPEEVPRQVQVSFNGEPLICVPVFVPSLKIGPISVCYFEGTEQDGYTLMGVSPILRFALMESEAIDPSDVTADYDLFSEAGIPLITDLPGEYGIIFIEEKYRDKLVPGEGTIDSLPEEPQV